MSFYDDASLILIPSGYKTSKLYSAKPTDGSGDLTFTRTGSTATRVNSSGLIEECRTNIILQSQNLTTTWAASRSSIVSNSIISPDGVNNSFTLIDNTDNNLHYLSQTFSAVTGPHTMSVYVKSKDLSQIQIVAIGGTTAMGRGFDLSTVSTFSESVAGVSSNDLGESITDVGNGWYRCRMSWTATGQTSFWILLSSSGNAGYAGTGTNGIYLWGAQLEIGDIATAYIPTTSAAVTVGPVANLPRLDYTGGGCPKLLMEPTRTNLVLYSEAFNNAAWSGDAGTISANASVSPDGYTNADKLIPSTSLASQNRYPTSSFTVSTTADTTYSIFAKADGYSFIQMTCNSATVSGNPRANFNLSNGTLGSFDAGTSPTITSYGNGWYRCTITVRHTLSPSAVIVQVVPSSTSARFAQLQGNGTSGVLLYGAQAEAGSYATSYIPTWNASVTRNADGCEKTSISSLIGQTEGTFFAEVTLLGTTGNFNVLNTSNSLTNSISMHIENGQFRGYLYATSSLRNSILGGTATAGNTYKIAYAYKSGDAALYVNGVQIGTNNQTFTFSAAVSKIEVADTDTFFSYQEAIKFSDAMLFTKRLSNTDLANITTL